MNAKEISDATLESVTPADNDLMLIYDTSAGTTGKATIADIAPKVAENIDIATLPAVTPATDDVLMIRDTSAGKTGKATIAECVKNGSTVTYKNISYSSFVNPSDFINSQYSSLFIIKYNALTVLNIYILVDGGVPIDTAIKVTDNVKTLLEVNNVFDTEIYLGGVVSNDNVWITDRKAVVTLNSNSLYIRISDTNGGWIRTQIIV